MKIDLSTLALILLAVLPGYCAFQIRNLLSPRSFAAKGPTEELASFVAISILTHGLLAFVVASASAVLGLCTFRDPLHYLVIFDSIAIQDWFFVHKSFGILLLFAYIFASCMTGVILGILAAFMQLGGLEKSWKRFNPRLRKWFRRRGIRGLLGERPVIYDAFTPPLDECCNEQLLFIEAELKGGSGFYTGQVARYAILKDEDPHKLILLQGVFFSPDRASDYQALDCDTLLLDLADVLVLRVRAHPDPDLLIQIKDEACKTE